MKLDRELQRKILEVLREASPKPLDRAQYQPLLDAHDNSTLFGNLLYLEGHGLITSGVRSGAWKVSSAAITAKGMDFLEDDGGLAAILGVVTVRLHDDTIKALIETKIMASDLSPSDKKLWIDQLRSLPADATKHLVLKLVAKGLEHGPAAMLAIENYLRTHGCR